MPAQQTRGNSQTGHGVRRYRRSLEVELSHDGNGFIFRPDRGEIFLLNHTGVMAYRLHKDGVASAEIARQLTRRFSVPPERAEADIRDFFTQFRVYGVTLDR